MTTNDSTDSNEHAERAAEAGHVPLDFRSLGRIALSTELEVVDLIDEVEPQ